MRAVSLLFRITTIVIFLQLLVGGLLTFNFINAGVHIVTGIIVFMLAIATMVAALVSKPRFRPLLITSIALVLLIMLQIILGFNTLSNGSQIVAWVHFANAMVIFGIAVSGTFAASRIPPLVGAKSVST